MAKQALKDIIDAKLIEIRTTKDITNTVNNGSVSSPVGLGLGVGLGISGGTSVNNNTITQFNKTIVDQQINNMGNPGVKHFDPGLVSSLLSPLNITALSLPFLSGGMQKNMTLANVKTFANSTMSLGDKITFIQTQAATAKTQALSTATGTKDQVVSTVSDAKMQAVNSAFDVKANATNFVTNQLDAFKTVVGNANLVDTAKLLMNNAVNAAIFYKNTVTLKVYDLLAIKGNLPDIPSNTTVAYTEVAQWGQNPTGFVNYTANITNFINDINSVKNLTDANIALLNGSLHTKLPSYNVDLSSLAGLNLTSPSDFLDAITPHITVGNTVANVTT